MTTQTELEKQLKAMNEKLDEIKLAVSWITAMVSIYFILTVFVLTQIRVQLPR